MNWHGITFGNNFFVAIASGGSNINYSMFSDNGINWKFDNTPDYISNRAVIYSEDLGFISVRSYGINNRIMIRKSP